MEFITSPKLEKIYENVNKHKNQIGLVYSQFVGAGGLGVLQRFLELHNWKKVEISPKPKVSPGAKVSTKESNIGTADNGELDEYIDDQSFEIDDVITGSDDKFDMDGYLAKIDSTPVSGSWWLSGDKFDEEQSGELFDNDPNDKLGGTNILDEIISEAEVYHKSTQNHNLSSDGNLPQKHKQHKISSINGKPGHKSPTHKSYKHGGVDKTNQPEIRYYAVISGEVDVEDRTRIQNMFNSEENKHGGVIDLILVSSTGAEGLDLKNVRHIHIMEPYWNWGRIAQIKARGIRNDSHRALQENEKDVQTYVYLAVAPSNLADRSKTAEALTTDEDLYKESLLNQISIDSFNEALKEVAIECLLNDEKYCRVCGPTNSKLFSDDFQRDMKSKDPCSEVKEKQVVAKEIIINSDKYYYVSDPESIYDYKIFEFDKSVNGYKVMRESNKLFEKIIDEIKKIETQDKSEK